MRAVTIEELHELIDVDQLEKHFKGNVEYNHEEMLKQLAEDYDPKE